MTTVIWLMGYLALGVGVVMLTRWMDVWDFREYAGADEPFPLFVVACLLFWPVALVLAVALAAMRATEHAKERRTTIREEAAREARKAAQEVEEFLRGVK